MKADDNTLRLFATDDPSDFTFTKRLPIGWDEWWQIFKNKVYPACLCQRDPKPLAGLIGQINKLQQICEQPQNFQQQNHHLFRRHLLENSRQHQLQMMQRVCEVAARIDKQPSLLHDNLEAAIFNGFAPEQKDLYEHFRQSNRRTGYTIQLGVLLEQESRTLGAVARLEVELVPNGCGAMYHDICYCERDHTDHPYQPFGEYGDRFLNAGQRSWEQVVTELSAHDLAQNYDIRFRLIERRVPNYPKAMPLEKFEGRSAEAAFYLCLRQAVLTLRGTPDTMQLSPALAISATLLEGNQLGLVGGLKNKLEAAWRRQIRHVIFPEAARETVLTDYKTLSAQIGGDLNGPTVFFCDTTSALLTKLRELHGPAAATRQAEYENCRYLRLLHEKSLPIEKYYKEPQLLLEVRREELPKEQDENDDLRKKMRLLTMTQAEDRRRQVRVSAEARKLADVFGNFQQAIHTTDERPISSASRIPQMIVLGLPGMGKTMLTQHLTWACQHQFEIDHPSLRLRSANGEGLIPARISLREWQKQKCPPLARYLAKRHQKTLTDCGLVTPKKQEQCWQKWLDTGVALILADGLDEITPDSADHLRTELEKLNNCPFVITCRTLNFESYQGYFSRQEIPVFRLGELSRGQQEEYINAYPTEFPQRFDRQKLLQQLQTASQMQPLAAVPLLLSIICLVVDDPQGVQLPARRSELYDKAITKLLQRSRGGASLSDVAAADKKLALAHAALELFIGADRELQFDRSRLRCALSNGLRATGHRTSKANNLIEDLIENSGLLRRTHNDDYEFLHLTLQEFLCAAALAERVQSKGWSAKIRIEKRDVTIRQLTNAKTWDANWPEVLALFTGCLNNILDVKALLNIIVAGQQDDHYRHRLTVAAYCLAEIGDKKSLINEINEITNTAFWCWWRFLYERVYWNDRYLVWIEDLQNTLPSLIQLKGEIQITTSDVSNKAAIPSVLTHLLRTGDTATIPIAASAMQKIGAAAATNEVLATFAEVLISNDETVTEAVIGTIKVFGAAAATNEFLAALVAPLQSEDPNIQDAAIEVIKTIGPDAITPEILAALAEVLRSGNSKTIEHVVEAIKRSGAAAVTKEFLAAMVEVLRSGDNDAKYSTVRAIKAIGLAAATPEILAAMAEVLRLGDTSAKYATVEAIGAIGAVTATPEILAAMAEALCSEDSKMQNATVKAIAAIGPTAATNEFLAALVEVLRSEKREMQNATVEAIRAIGPTAATNEFLAALVEVLRSEDVRLKYVAVRAIEAIGPTATTNVVLIDLAEKLGLGKWKAQYIGKKIIERIGSGPILEQLAAMLHSKDWRTIDAAIQWIIEVVGAVAATPEILAALAEVLRLGDIWAKYVTVEAIGEIGPAATPEILASLAEVLRSGGQNTQDVVIWALEESGVNIAPETLASLIQNAAANLIQAIGPAAATPEILASLAEALHSGASIAKYAMVKAIKALGPAAATPEILAALAEVLRSGDQNPRDAALSVIGALGGAAATNEFLTAMAELLRSENKGTRNYAKYAIERISFAAATNEFLAVLVALLHSEDQNTKSAATWVIGALGPAAAIPEILSALVKELRAGDRYEAVKAINRIGAAAATDEFLAALVALLRSEDQKIQRAALWAMKAVGTAAATPEILAALVEVLRSSDKVLKQDAINSVGSAIKGQGVSMLVETIQEYFSDFLLELPAKLLKPSLRIFQVENSDPPQYEAKLLQDLCRVTDK